MKALCTSLVLTATLALAQDTESAEESKPAEEVKAAPEPKPAPAKPAAPKLSAEEILKRMEALNNGFEDQKMEIRLNVIDGDGGKKSYDMTMFQKGTTKRLVQFTSGELKGMSTLVESRDQVHVYLPGFKKVRRVAAHNMNQSVAGSDLSSEDMAQVSWLEGWNLKLEKEDDASYWLLLTPKSPDSSYARVQHRVAKDTFAQKESHYFNKAGEEVKRFVNTDFKDWGGVMRHRVITVSDPRTKRKTEMELQSFSVNQGLKDSLFTVRELQWGK